VLSKADKALTSRRCLCAVGDERPHRIAGCWVVRDVERNRRLIARYPELFGTRFPGSSASWVRALGGATGDSATPRSAPPEELGLVWCDARATRVFAWRRSH